MLPYLWVNLAEYLSLHQMEVKAIRGNGFCFLSAVTKVLEVDHKLIIPVQKAMEKIMNSYVRILKGTWHTTSRSLS